MAEKIFSKKELNRLIVGYKRKLDTRKIPVERMYLYGSYAKGRARQWSDIDLCVISSEFHDRIESTMMLMKLRGDEELIISPIAFSPGTFIEENPLAYEIRRTGVIFP